MKLPLALLAAVPALALAGCLAGEPVDTAATPPIEAAVPAPTAGVLYRVGGNGTLAVEDLDEAIPLPVGALRGSLHPSFEPTLGVASDGTIFLSTFDYAGLRQGEGVMLLQRTKDQGLTWEDATPRLPTGTSVPPQSNDPYVYVDPDTDRVFLSDLQALLCSTLSFSDDQGASWTTNPFGCGHPFGVQDHQTVFTAKPRAVATVGYPNVVYYCINRVADSACATSLNGGLSFGPLRPLVYSGVEPDVSGLPFSAVCGGLHAHGAAAPDGTVYLPRARCGVPQVAVTKDDGLTWSVSVISADVRALGHEVPVAVDEAGNVYATWTGEDRLPYLAVSTDAGATWGAPMMIAPPGVMTTYFPSIAAGADGRVVVSYMGTAADKAYDEMDPEDTWNGYLTVVTAATSADPVFATVTVNDPADPLARGVCGGTRCSGVGDFLDVVIDAEGRPWAAFVDVCDEGCVDGEENSGSLGVLGTLATGPRLRGEAGVLPALVEALPAEG